MTYSNERAAFQKVDTTTGYSLYTEYKQVQVQLDLHYQINDISSQRGVLTQKRSRSKNMIFYIGGFLSMLGTVK